MLGILVIQAAIDILLPAQEQKAGDGRSVSLEDVLASCCHETMPRITDTYIVSGKILDIVRNVQHLCTAARNDNTLSEIH